tara:strand:- start:360 stop:587 length:228 start_codon:yes stop_codon:yes gene_type:complete
MFGKNKNAILTTTLIVKVRKYKEEQPYFSLYTPPSMADQTKAREVVEKLNDVEEYNTEDQKEGWQTEYYAVPMTL